ncbi:hypothetical protein [Paenibacillus alginolyticus]|uniref:Uncharacterized protein n=1 Tax=Paenibacillus alginolyticus TaxID=59839 RepID=A0ABT4G7P4_9BACL|nr:hypothetical protein [Paenibacillus alginolyticus]MCY9692207.1 hypothetical protein [Paenibacillus alginolyticus]MEC0145954.1 hypothetical protein [Paenibacillus alginolyticus]
MVDELDIDTIVASFVVKYAINSGNYEGLRPQIRKQLADLEEFIQNNINEQKEISTRIKELKLSVLKVSDGSGVARSTINVNSDTLKVYIEQRINEIQVSDDILSINKTKNQNEENGFLKDYLNKTQDHLVMNEIYELKIEELENEIRNMNRTQEGMVLEISRLQRENDSLQHELRKNRMKNVVPIGKS